MVSVYLRLLSYENGFPRPSTDHNGDQLFLDKLTAVQWSKIESGSVDRETECIVTDMCEDIIQIISTNIYKAVLHNLSKVRDLTRAPPKSSNSSSGSHGSQRIVSVAENLAQECLWVTLFH